MLNGGMQPKVPATKIADGTGGSVRCPSCPPLNLLPAASPSVPRSDRRGDVTTAVELPMSRPLADHVVVLTRVVGHRAGHGRPPVSVPEARLRPDPQVELARPALPRQST